MQQKSHTVRPACVQKYGFVISPSAFQFQLRGKCVGQGGQLACFSDIFWRDAVCTTDDRSAVNQSQDYVNLYEFGFSVFLKTTLCVVYVV